jgi:hypothetical protein
MKEAIENAITEYLKTTDAAEKANEARKTAIRRIYDEIAGMLKEAGLDAKVIVSGNNVFNMLSLRIEFPDEGLSSRFSYSGEQDFNPDENPVEKTPTITVNVNTDAMLTGAGSMKELANHFLNARDNQK